MTSSHHSAPDNKEAVKIALGDAALACARRGWWVFPCRPGRKTPLTPHGLNDASLDEVVIRQWWQRYPQANIGVSCGPSGLLVIDIDLPAGPEAWRQLCQELGISVATVASITPTGGRHLFFAAPAGLVARNSAGRLAHGVDVRTGGGYVVVPPSKHPNGWLYRWAEGCAPGEHALAELPAPLAQRLAALADDDKGRPAAASPAKGAGRSPGVRDLHAYGQAALRRESESVRLAPEGTRNDRLNRAAFTLGRLVAQGCLAAGEVEEELAYAAMRAGLDARAIAATIRSGLSAGVAIGRHMTLAQQPAAAARPGAPALSTGGAGAPEAEAGEAAAAAPVSDEPPAEPPPAVEPPPGEPPAGATSAVSPNDFSLTDAGNGELLVALYGHRLRFDHDSGAWLLWSGTRWQPDRQDKVRLVAVEAARARRQAAGELVDSAQATRAERWAYGSENATRVRATLLHARSLPPVGVMHRELDADPWLLGCPNGVVDLRTGSLRPARPEDLITCATGTLFDPEARAPRWERFLREVCEDDEELVEFLARAAGYSLTGITREQVFFICLGEGANGKSTFLNMLRAVTGDYAGHATAGCFELRSFGDAASNDLAMLAGKRLVTAGETAEGRPLHEQRVKQLTGDDPITARFLYQENFTFVAQFKLWMATNHRPRILGTDNGIWRRVREIPFRASFQGREDPDLNAHLLAELPGILAWAVRGCLTWQRDGLGIPSVVAAANHDYRSESDPLRRFLAECVTRQEGSEVPARLLYSRYVRWCSDAHEQPLSETLFGTRLPGLGCCKRRGDLGVTYLDIDLTSPEA